MTALALLFLAVLALLAVVPAVIAQQKGEPALTWWLYGFLLWPVALAHAIWLEPIDRWHEEMNRLRADGLYPPA